MSGNTHGKHFIERLVNLQEEMAANFIRLVSRHVSTRYRDNLAVNTVYWIATWPNEFV